MELVAERLIPFVRDELLDPARVLAAVQAVNAKAAALANSAAPTAKVATLRVEVAELEVEFGRLVEALAKGTAYDAISSALAAKDRRLVEARAELGALTAPPPEAVPKVTAADVRARRAPVRRPREDVCPHR